MTSRADLIKAILAKSGPKPLAVNGLGFVKVMTAYDADVTRKKLEALKKDDGCETGRLLASLLCDESGELLFDAADAETVLKLSKLPPELQMQALSAGKSATDGPKA